MWFTSVVLSAALAHAFQGEISFSRQEQLLHQQGIKLIEDVAARCLDKDLRLHQEFYRKWGISKFYGDQSRFAKMTRVQRIAHLKQLGKPESLLDQMEPTSCIGLTLKCMEAGFKEARQEEIWQRLRAFTMANRVTGNALLHGLQALGWRLYYWNPDTSKNELWDQAEAKKNPTNSDRFWGYHGARWREAQRGRYFINKVDDASLLVNFGIRPPEELRRIPFFVGIAHTGYHVFPGSFGRIVEGHSTRLITDSQTIESSPFNPLADGGGPRGQYYSGLMAIPPGFLF
jgi:hypothetical protein